MNITEQKILSGIAYFVKHTKNVGRTKLFKLLFYLDFIHFKRFGKSVTGYEYYTYPFGPVPQQLFEQINKDELPKFLKDSITIEVVEDKEENQFISFQVKVKNKKVDFDWLSPNEKAVLEEVAFIFKDATGSEMKEITHLPNTPWDKTIKEKGMFKPIDYFLALDKESSIELEDAKERFKLQRELLADGRI